MAEPRPVTADELYDFLLVDVDPNLTAEQAHKLVTKEFKNRPLSQDALGELNQMYMGYYQGSNEPIRPLEELTAVGLTDADLLKQERALRNMVESNLSFPGMAYDEALHLTLEQMAGKQPIFVPNYRHDSLTKDEKNFYAEQGLDVYNQFPAHHVDATLADGPKEYRKTADKDSADLHLLLEEKVDKIIAGEIAGRTTSVDDLAGNREKIRQNLIKNIFGYSNLYKKGYQLHKNAVFQEIKAIENDPRAWANFKKAYMQHYLFVPIGAIKIASDMQTNTLVLDPSQYGIVAETLMKSGGSAILDAAQKSTLKKDPGNQEDRKYAEIAVLSDAFQRLKETSYSEMLMGSLEEFKELEKNQQKLLLSQVPQLYRNDVKRLYDLYVTTLEERNEKAEHFIGGLDQLSVEPGMFGVGEYERAQLDPREDLEATIDEARSELESYEDDLPDEPTQRQLEHLETLKSRVEKAKEIPTWEPLTMDSEEWRETYGDVEKDLHLAGQKLEKIADQLTAYTGVKLESGWIFKAGSKLSWEPHYNSIIKRYAERKTAPEDLMELKTSYFGDPSSLNSEFIDMLKNAMSNPFNQHSDETFDPIENTKTLDDFMLDNALRQEDLPIGIRRLDDKKDQTFSQSQAKAVIKLESKGLKKDIDEYNGLIKVYGGTERTLMLNSFIRMHNLVQEKEFTITRGTKELNELAELLKIERKKLEKLNEDWNAKLEYESALVEKFTEPGNPALELLEGGIPNQVREQIPDWDGWEQLEDLNDAFQRVSLISSRWKRLRDQIFVPELKPFGKSIDRKEMLKRLYLYPKEKIQTTVGEEILVSQAEFWQPDRDIGLPAGLRTVEQLEPEWINEYQLQAYNEIEAWDDYVRELEGSFKEPEIEDTAQRLSFLEHRIGRRLQRINAERETAEAHPYLNPGGGHPISMFENVAQAANYGPALDEISRNPEFLSLFGIDLMDAMMTIDKGYVYPEDAPRLPTLGEVGFEAIRRDLAIQQVTGPMGGMGPRLNMAWAAYKNWEKEREKAPGAYDITVGRGGRKVGEMSEQEILELTLASTPIEELKSGRGWRPEDQPWVTVRPIDLVGKAKFAPEMLKPDALKRILDRFEITDLEIEMLKSVKGRRLRRKIYKYMDDPSVEFNETDVSDFMDVMQRPLLNSIRHKMFLYRTQNLPKELVNFFDLTPDVTLYGRDVFGEAFSILPFAPRALTAPDIMYRPKSKGGVTDLGFNFLNFMDSAKRNYVRTIAGLMTEKAALDAGVPAASIIDKEQKIDAAARYLTFRSPDVFSKDTESGRSTLITDPDKVMENMKLAVDAQHELMRFTGAVFSEQEGTLDAHLRYLIDADPERDPIISGQMTNGQMAPLANMSISMYPTYLQNEIRRGIEYPVGTTKEGKKPPYEEYAGLTLQDAMALYDIHDFGPQNIIDFATLRYSQMNSTGHDFLHWVMDGSFEPTLDPANGIVTYKNTTFGWYMNFVAPAAPRLLLEAAKSVLHYTGADHWEQKHDFSVRVLASLSVGDPGAMGEFGYQMGRFGMEYDHPLRNAARMVGFGADFMINWEGKLAFLPRAGLRRGAWMLRTNAALQNAGDFSSFGRTLALGSTVFTGAKVLGMGDLTSAGTALGAALFTAVGDYKNFQKTKNSIAPYVAAKMPRSKRYWISFKSGMYDVHLDFAPMSLAGAAMKLSEVVPYSMKKFGWGRNALKKIDNNRWLGILRGQTSRIFADLNHQHFRNKVKSGVTPDDIVIHYLYKETFDLLGRQDFWDTEDHIMRLKLTGKKREQFRKGHEDLKTEIQALALKAGINPDIFVRMLRERHYGNLSKVAIKARMILEGEGKVSKAVSDTRSYKSIVRILDRKVDDGIMTDGQRQLVIATHLAAADILFPEDPKVYFQKFNARVEALGLSIDERVRTSIGIKDILESEFDKIKKDTITKDEALKLAKAISNGVDAARQRRFATTGGLAALSDVIGDIDLVPVDKFIGEQIVKVFDNVELDTDVSKITLESVILDAYSGRLKGINDDVLERGGQPKAKKIVNNRSDYKSTNVQFLELVDESRQVRINKDVDATVKKKRAEAKKKNEPWNDSIKNEEINKAKKSAKRKITKEYPRPERIQKLKDLITQAQSKILDYRHRIDVENAKRERGEKARKTGDWERNLEIAEENLTRYRRDLNESERMNNIMSNVRDERTLRKDRNLHKENLDKARKESESKLAELENEKRTGLITQEQFDAEKPASVPSSGRTYRARWSISPRRADRTDKNRQAILRYTDEVGTIILDELSGTWLFDEDFSNPAAVAASDYHYRKTVLTKLIEYAAYHGKNELYIPIGERGIFHQMFGEGEKIGIIQYLENKRYWLKEKNKELADKTNEIQAYEKYKAEYEQKDPADRDIKEFTKQTNDIEKTKKQTTELTNEIQSLEKEINELEPNVALKGEPEKIKAFDKAMRNSLASHLKQVNQLYNDLHSETPQEILRNSSKIAVGQAKTFDKANLIPGRKYIKVTIGKSLRKSLLPQEEGTKYSGPNFERLKSVPLTENVESIKISAANLNDLFAKRSKENLNKKTDDDVQQSLEQAKQERDELLRQNVDDEVIDPFGFFDHSENIRLSIDLLNERIGTLSDVLETREGITTEMRKVQGVYPDGSHALIYTMEDKHGNQVMIQVRPTETTTQGSPVRNILVIEDFAYENAPQAFNRHDHNHAFDLEREYYRYEVKLNELSKEKERADSKAQKRKVGSAISKVKASMKSIRAEIIEKGYYDLLGPKFESRYEGRELARAKSSATMYSHSLFRDQTGEPRRVANEFIKAAIADGYTGFAYGLNEGFGGAILDELRQANGSYALRMAQLNDQQKSFMFVHLGTAENMYRRRTESLNGVHIEDGIGKIIFDGFAADVFVGRKGPQTPKQREDEKNAAKWLGLEKADNDVFEDRLLRSAHQYQEGFIRDYNGLTYDDVISLLSKTERYLANRKNSKKFFSRQMAKLNEKINNLEEPERKAPIGVEGEGLTQRDLLVDSLNTLKEKQTNNEKSIKLLNQTRQKIIEIQNLMKASGPRIVNQHWFSNPNPNGRHVRMPIYVNPELSDMIKSFLAPEKWETLQDLKRQMDRYEDDGNLDGFFDLSAQAYHLEMDLRHETMLSDVAGIDHVFVNGIFETKQGSKMRSGRKTLVVNGLGLENKDLNNLMGREEFILPIISRIAREAAANGFEAIAINMHIDPELFANIRSMKQALFEIAHAWGTKVESDLIQTERTSFSKELTLTGEKAETFNDFIEGRRDENTISGDFADKIKDFRSRWEEIKGQPKMPKTPYEFLLIAGDKDLLVNFEATESLQSGRIFEAAFVMPITEIMRRSVPNKGKQVALRNERFVLKEDIDGTGDITRRMDVIYLPAEREQPFSSSMMNELAFYDDKNYAIIDTPFARYQIEIKNRPEIYNPEIIDVLATRFERHPIDPEGLMEDSPIAKELMNKFQSEEDVKTLIRHIYYTKVMNDYAKVFEEYGYEVSATTPRSVFDGIDFDQQRSLRQQRHYAERTRDTPISSRAQFTDTRVHRSADTTGKIATDADGENHTYTKVAPIAHLDTGLTTLDHFALLDGIGLDDIMVEMKLRIEDLLTGNVTRETIRRSFALGNISRERVNVEDLPPFYTDLIKRAIYNDVEVFKYTLDGPRGVQVDTKAIARVATADELKTIKTTPDLSDAEADALINKFKDVLSPAPTKNLTTEELNALGAYLGFDHLLAEDVQKHIVEKQRFLDINELKSFQNFELGKITSKTIRYEGKLRQVQLTEPRSKMPFEDHPMFTRSGLFQALSKEISYNFENLSEFTPINMYLSHAILSPTNKFFDMLERPEVLETLDLSPNEGEFLQTSLHKYKIRGKEAVARQNIMQLPEDQTRSYDVDIPEEELAYINRFNDEFDMVFDPDASFEDFLMANENVIELMMPPTAHRIANGFFQSKGGRLTKRGRKEFTEALYRHMTSNDPPPSGKYALMMSESFSFLDRLRAYFTRTQRNPSVDRMGKPHMKMTNNAIETWNAVFNPGSRAINEAYAFWESDRRYAPQITITTQADVPLPIQATIAKKLEKSQMLMPDISREQLMRELNSDAFDPYNPKLIQRSDNHWEMVPGLIEEGTTIDVFEMFRRLYTIAITRRYKDSSRLMMHTAIAGGGGALYRPLTLRTSVPIEKIAPMQKSAGDFMDSLFSEGLDEVVRDSITLSTDEFLKKNGFQIKEYEAGRFVEITEGQYDRFFTDIVSKNEFAHLDLPNIFRNKDEFLVRRAQTTEGAPITNAKGEALYRLYVKEYNALKGQLRLDPRNVIRVNEQTAKRIINAANNLASMPMGDIVPLILVDWKLFKDHRFIQEENSYFIYNSELQEMSDAFLDTTAPIYAARSRKLEGAPRTMLEAIVKSWGQVFEDIGEKGHYDKVKKWWRSAKELFVTPRPFEHLPPDIAEILEKHRAILTGLVDDLFREIEEMENTAPSKRMGNIWKMLHKYSEDFVPPVRTELIPTFYSMKDRFETYFTNEVDSPNKPLTVDEFLSEDFLSNMQTILDSGQKQMTIKELETLNSLRELKQLHESGHAMKGDFQHKLHENIYAITIAFRRRQKAIEQISNVIIQAILGQTPSQINPFLNPGRQQSLQRRAYTLFYEGRWAPTRTRVSRAFAKFTDVEQFESRLLTELTVESVVEFLRDRGWSFAETTNEAVRERANRVLKEMNRDIQTRETPEPYYKIPDFETELDAAGKKQLLDSLNTLLSQESEKPRFRSLTEIAYELGGRDIMEHDPYTGFYLTDPSRVFAEILLNLRAHTQQKRMWNEITKIRGELDLDQVLLEYVDWGANPIKDEDKFKQDLLNQINLEMSFMAGNVVEEGLSGEAGTLIRAQKQGKIERLKTQLENLEEGEELPQFAIEDIEINMNQAREIMPYEPDRDLMIQMMAKDIIERIGIRVRGSHALDQIAEYTNADGRTMLLPVKTIDAIRDAEEAILAGGRQIGSVTSTDFGKVIRNIDGEVMRMAQDVAFEKRDLERLKRTLTTWEKLQGHIAKPFVGEDLQKYTAEELAVMTRKGRESARLLIGWNLEKNWKLMKKTLQENGKLTKYGNWLVVGTGAIAGGTAIGALGGLGVTQALIGYGFYAAAATIHKKIYETAKFAGLSESKIQMAKLGLESMGDYFAKIYDADGTKRESFATDLQREMLKIDEFEDVLSQNQAEAHEKGMVARQNLKDKITERDLQKDAAIEGIEIDSPEYNAELKKRLKEVRLEKAYADAYFKTLKRSNIRYAAEGFLNVMTPENMTASIKMAVTVGPGTLPYYMANIFGMAQQLLMARLSEGFVYAAMAGGVAASATARALDPEKLAGVGYGLLGFGAGALTQQALHPYLTERRTPKGASFMHRPKQVMGLLMNRQPYLRRGPAMAIPMAAIGGIAGAVAAGPVGAGIGAAATGFGGYLASKKYRTPYKYLSHRPGEPYDIPPIMTPDGKIYFASDLARMIEEHQLGSTYLKAETGTILVKQIEELYEHAGQKLISWFGGKRYRKMLVEMSEAHDSYVRIQAFLDLLEAGHRPKEAAEQVRNAMFDYSDLTDFEKAILRNVFLFYSFMRKNTEFVLATIMKNPDKIHGFLRARRDLMHMAFEAAEPELMADRWWDGRFLYPLLGINVQSPVTKDGRGTPYWGIYDKFVPVSPMTNDFDGIALFTNIIAATGLHGKDFVGPSGQDATAYLTNMLNPMIGAIFEKQFGRTSFGNMPLDKIRASSRLIALDAFMGRLLHGRGQGFLINTSPASGQKKLINLESVSVDKFFPGFDEITGEMEPASKKRLEQMARLIMNPAGNPILDGTYFKPATESDGFKLNLLDRIAAPGILSQLPVVSLVAGTYTGRGGQVFSNFDRGDLGKWMLGSQFVTEMLDSMGGLTVEAIMKEADDKKLSNEQTKSLFGAYFHNRNPQLKLEHAKALYDVYIRPEGLPPEIYWAKVLGVRYIPIKTFQQAARSVFNDLYMKAKKPKETKD